MFIVNKTTRREFLEGAAKLGLSIASASYLWDMISPQGFANAAEYKEVWWYKRMDGEKVQCEICPRNCVLANGEACFCQTRTNINGKLVTSAWNNPSVLEIAKIESAPLFHYAVGKEFLGMGLSGCNLRCQYCQNFTVSQKGPNQTKNYKLNSLDAVRQSKRKELAGILFTYTEPAAYLEYLIFTADKAKANGLRVAAATSGYMNRNAVMETAKYVDAFAVTLKGFNNNFYQKVCAADIQPVLNAMETIKRQGKWLEVVNLIIPAMNDEPSEIRGIARWIKENLGTDTPLHFARFYPAYKFKDIQSTPLQSLENARRIAMDAGLKYVYTTNMAGHPGSDTYCSNCGNAVINRKGFDVVKTNLKSDKCGYCGKEVAGSFFV